MWPQRRLSTSWWRPSVRNRLPHNRPASPLFLHCRRFSTQGSTWHQSLLSLSCTEHLARLLAQFTTGSDVLCLMGDMGIGKTAFARAFVQGFFDDPSMPVRSPSYLLELPYDGPAKPGITIRHIDLFRCSGPEDLEVLGLLTAAQLKAGRDPHIFLPSNEIALIEWPESVGLRFMPENRLDIHFSMAQQEEHLVNGIDGHPEEDEDFFGGWPQLWRMC